MVKLGVRTRLLLAVVAVGEGEGDPSAARIEFPVIVSLEKPGRQLPREADSCLRGDLRSMAGVVSTTVSGGVAAAGEEGGREGEASFSQEAEEGWRSSFPGLISLRGLRRTCSYTKKSVY